MPANLNALIRYKTIDRYLGRKFGQYTIGQLQELCSEALGEFCGVYKKVSERTIRDDIRVMRSEILGFNAPIICEGGYYSYSDPNYSIFSVSIKDLNLLKQVMQILLDNRVRLRDYGVDEIIRELGGLIKSTSSVQYMEEPVRKSLRSYSALEDALYEKEPGKIFDEKASEPSRKSKLIKRLRIRKKMKEDSPKDIFYPMLIEDSEFYTFFSERKILIWGDILKLVG